MREKTILLSTVLILLLAFFSSSTDYTGTFISRSGYYVPDRSEQNFGENVCDVNGNGAVDKYDYDRVFQTAEGTANYPFTDLNDDGFVNYKDVDIVIACLAEAREPGTSVSRTRGSQCFPGEIECAPERGGLVGKVGLFRKCVYDPFTDRYDFSSETYHCADEYPGTNKCVSEALRLPSRSQHDALSDHIDSCEPGFSG